MAGPSHRPTVTDLHQQASKITTAQKAWNVLGLIFGIAIGNSLGQMEHPSVQNGLRPREDEVDRGRGAGQP